MKRLNGHLIVGVSICLLCVGVSRLPARPLGGKLVVHPAEVTSEAGKYALLPKPESLRDGDAVPLYNQAIAALPSAPSVKQMGQWLNLPTEQFPLDTVEGVIQQHMESLRLAAKAVRSRECNWPAWKPGMPPLDHSGYRKLAFVMRLWARFEMVNGRYDGALLAIQTVNGMARHLCDAPSIGQAMVGIAVAGVTCREVEQFVQCQDAPNLSKVLADLPRPFVDIEQVIARETQAAGQGLLNRLTQKMTQNQLKQSYDRVRMIANRLECNLAALQCVEAIRAYAASHEGQLPSTLDDIDEVSVPNDPMSGQPFNYTRTGSDAALESVVPEGGDKKDQIRYEIVLKK
jgi:hypothetical protein